MEGTILTFLGYITYFLALIGVSDYFAVSVVLYVVMLLSNLAAFPFIEIFGRRPLLLYGIVGLTSVLLVCCSHSIFHVVYLTDNINVANGYNGLHQCRCCSLGHSCLHLFMVHR